MEIRALAMRVLACSSVGMVDEFDLCKLLTLQSSIGSWEDGWIYKHGSSGILIANNGLTTAFAINAIESMKPRHDKKVESTHIIESDFTTEAGVATSSVKALRAPLPSAITASLRNCERVPSYRLKINC